MTDQYLNKICRMTYGNKHADSEFNPGQLTKALESNCTPEALAKAKKSLALVQKQVVHRKELPDGVIIF